MRNVSDKLNHSKIAGNWYLCSLVVQAKPEKLDSIKATLLSMPNTEIHGEKPEEGKLIVVIESDFQPQLVEQMESIKDIDGVIVVSLIYSHQDEKH
ncbi:chaperone NapD [Otariodibacter oris]|uniref:Chaperone NapD n=1 Tax=Otariodibacter oris TaxID=1032623 RepID=A0A420XGI4_9PAST|nr:chaperone NapD [Otariodibacter oris]QGM80091.1 reductase [Otariodibacter oris]RKR71918.1 periplasmic nitrate reductase chaperone NapD [Otariodibacter oris]